MSHLTRGVQLITVAVAIVLLVGCTKSTRDSALDGIRERNRTNLQKLTTSYSMYHGFVSSGGPKSADDLKKFIADNPGIEVHLQRIGLKREDFENCFADEDGKPITVFYGVREPAGPKAAQPIIFSGSSVETLYVGFSDASVREVSLEEYEELLALAKKKK